jgi:phospholipase C
MRFTSVVPALVAITLALSGCSGGVGTLAPASPVLSPSRASHQKAAASITHIVLIIQENRSFDNLFATFPKANGTMHGTMHTGQVIPLVKGPLVSEDIDHEYGDYQTDCDLQGGKCKMDGFDLQYIDGNKSQKAGKYPYRYVDPSQITPYWTLAQQYVLADNFFQTQGSGSFTAHQDLIAGGTAINSTESLIDDPSTGTWQCNAPPSTVTSLITIQGQFLFDQGPYPCLTYPTGTLRDLLDKQHITWKYYAPLQKPGTIGVMWNAFGAIDAVYHGPEWTTNISTPETNILTDVTSGKLPMLSWVIPTSQDSDHPWTVHGVDDGPSWVASVVNAIGQSSYWNSTAIIILWDDWGGFYDHVPPAFFDDAGGLGFRVPVIIVSPYVKAGSIAHTQYEYGSILKFIEGRFGLGSLGTTDKRATSIGGLFNLNQKPIPFQVIPSVRSRDYFLHKAPDYHPVDAE